MNSVQQQHEHLHQKVLIGSFHLSGHTFSFRWTVQDLEVFLDKLNFSMPCFFVQIKHKSCKNMNCVQQQCDHHHQKVLMDTFLGFFMIL